MKQVAVIRQPDAEGVIPIAADHSTGVHHDEHRGDGGLVPLKQAINDENSCDVGWHGYLP